MKRSRMALGVCAVMAVCLTACKSLGDTGAKAAAAGDGRVYEIRLHHDLSEESAQHSGLLEFQKVAEDKSGGRLDIQIFPDSALGTDTEVAELLEIGSVEAALIPTAKLSSFYPPLQILDLPFLFPSRDVCYNTLDDAGFRTMVFGPMEELGFHGINFWESGFKQFTANRVLEEPEDFQGLRFRTMESPMIMSQFEALGASALPMDFGETYSALQRGAVDGQENPLVSIVNMKFYEVQKNCIISNHGYLSYAFLFSRDYWDRLPADLQQVIEEAAEAALQKERQITIDREDGYIKIIEESGCEVTYLSEEEKEELAEVLYPVYEEYRDEIGPELLDATCGMIDALTN